MKEHKGINIYNFLEENKDLLKDFKNETLLAPLHRCKEIVEKYMEKNNWVQLMNNKNNRLSW